MAKDRLLVVEDDGDILQLLTFTLESAGFEVFSAMDGKTGLELAMREKPDLVVLDLMLPGMSGLDVCKDLKRMPETQETPVIMLTARGEEVDRIVGLELGADDYVVKPFSPRELVLRIKAVLKRGAPFTEQEERTRWRVNGLSLDTEAHRVEIDGDEVTLTATEFKLLFELVRNRGRVRTRDQLLNTVWGYEFEGYARTVDTHVRRLRQKIGDYAGYIETIRGVGYRFRE
ncbi:two component transcriptional regulator, winged helix family [Oleidesulfovibrio alaskensis G20]|jgi:two-component system phosphate regulon response regulator PhoB|uniref:Phosphate regulon transcriptional regulatory protein PhoB n=1 Tax=Oleidesulfovibrio alaskensis (strain ATCC BAA-1058 / DSM 17464 / G20) TaxID=207559 RepID=Q30YR2_OLEA2|nr:response regulator transcription factor [Oleidesulfovibrio alaskensis]ABB39184.1 two component transcriptional regulator, winged helix family [Oleidesulfovibrio alaskensis G20]MBG0772057.1 response regulator transcription factor [Oleidesulfovibrio alaskensis]MBL3581705.1 response regulator transcription factor [Oleidesulfovibrio alaskensis]